MVANQGKKEPMTQSKLMQRLRAIVGRRPAPTPAKKAPPTFKVVFTEPAEPEAEFEEAPHGLYRYGTLGCRCDVCKEAKSIANAEYRARRRVNGGKPLRVSKSARRKKGEIKHGVSAYQYHGCRCKVCVDAKREANAAAQRRRMEKRKGIKAEPVAPAKPVKSKGEKKNKIRHGTVTGYNYYSCRCAKCKKARVDYFAKRKEATITGPIVHGTLSAYQYSGCRCEKCSIARREYDRERKARLKPSPSQGKFKV